MAFNIGDRVRYFGPYPQGGKADFGTIVSRDNRRVGVWWVDWDNGERLLARDIHLELINAELSVKELKDLLNKMDDSIRLSFTDLKIHFG